MTTIFVVVVAVSVDVIDAIGRLTSSNANRDFLTPVTRTRVSCFADCNETLAGIAMTCTKPIPFVIPPLNDRTNTILFRRSLCQRNNLVRVGGQLAVGLVWPMDV